MRRHHGPQRLRQDDAVPPADGELSPDSGEIHIAAGKKLGLISQIPVYPAGFSVEDVLRTAFAALASLKRRMEELEKRLKRMLPERI